MLQAAQRAARGGKRPRPAADSRARDDPAGGVVELVRTLVARAGDRAREPALTDDGMHRLLLDVEVDGFRCILLGPGPAERVPHALSPREQEIARMVAQGYPNKTIASVLEISTWTVATYLRRIFAKLGVRSRAAMVALVVEEGLLPEGHADWPRQSDA
jgi:DNA-binding CsgD family transcriptional regulator